MPLALIDGGVLTARRTAAASALAASYLARSDSRRLLVVGAGAVARLLPEAYRTVLSIEQVAVWARSAQKAAALAAGLRASGVMPSPPPTWPPRWSAADIVSCATLATEPLVQGRWLQPGSHLDLIGGFTPAMREADDACFAGARLYVDTDEALRKSGDLLGPMTRGVFDGGASLRHAGRAVPAQRRRPAVAAGAHRVQVGGHRARGPGGGNAGPRERLVGLSGPPPCLRVNHPAAVGPC